MLRPLLGEPPFLKTIPIPILFSASVFGIG